MGCLLRKRVVAPRSSCPAACFERLIFADENRCNHPQEFLGDPADRTFSGYCSCNPEAVARFAQRLLDVLDLPVE
jgi:hypothetical protein